MIFLAILNTIIFALLALLHFYWAASGKWARKLAIPVDKKGRRVFQPRPAGTLLVALGLSFFAAVTFSNVVSFTDNDYTALIHYSNWAIGIIFLWRSIGDFKFFGFWKRIRHTEFAQYDTKLYSPLAFAIAIVSFVIATWN